MSNKYELSTQTLIDAMSQIPQERWSVFCSELHAYMVSHHAACEGMKMLAELGMLTFEEPKTMTWIDDNNGDVSIICTEQNSGEQVTIVKSKVGDNHE